jgi:hypothetical protein
VIATCSYILLSLQLADGVILYKFYPGIAANSIEHLVVKGGAISTYEVAFNLEFATKECKVLGKCIAWTKKTRYSPGTRDCS